jgi:aspartate/methionine/tyrosine aminotransferase
MGIRASIVNMPPQLIREVSIVGMGDPDVIPLWFGESDIATPKFICDAATRALAEGRTFYNPNRGIPELRQALSEYMSDLYRRPIGLDRVTVTPSGVNAIIQSTEMLLDPGDDVVCVSPVWPNIAGGIRIMSGSMRTVGIEFSGDRWTLDFDRLIDAIKPETRLVVVNSPSNPTGWVMSSEEQKALLAHCRARGIWIMSDEVYARIVYGRRAAPSFLEHAEPEDRVIVINSFSKPWAMTGWRVGWITHPPGLGKTYEMIGEYNMSCATTFAQYGAIAALKEGEGFIQESTERYQRGRDLVFQRLGANPRIRMGLPEGAFYAFFGVEGLTDSLEVAKDIVRKAKVGLAPGAAFGAESEGFIRLCFASQTPTISKALDRLEEYFATSLR